MQGPGDVVDAVVVVLALPIRDRRDITEADRLKPPPGGPKEHR
jgi:hypothetical protein